MALCLSGHLGERGEESLRLRREHAKSPNRRRAVETKDPRELGGDQEEEPKAKRDLTKLHELEHIKTRVRGNTR